jgi:hypothetical protein
MATNSKPNPKFKSASPAPAPAAKAAKDRIEPTQEEIGVRAHQIWLSEGCQEGKDLENWLRAEKELNSGRK